MSPGYVCNSGCPAQYPELILEEKLFWASEKIPDDDAKCPRCGGCCNSSMEDLSV